VFLGFLILALIEKRRKTVFFTKKMGHFDGSDTSLCGIILLVAGFSVAYVAVTGGLAELGVIDLIAAVLGTLAYGFAGCVLLFKKRTYPSVGFAFLVLAGYYIIRLVRLFLENYIILSMSEHLIRLIITMTLPLFFLSAGRMFLRAESKTTRIKVCVFGFFTATAAVSEVTAKLIFLFGSPRVTRNSLMNSAATQFIAPDMLAAAEAVVLVTFLLTLLRRKPERVRNNGRERK
jgi:hypothetical protein